ncbi:isoprenyl transferase [Tumebacillus permanentifrigoris]|uniref:Isoprenyl transferase n=1 Tax=Tumebacillus permanentifrigoris TaxID=378543 RepID=A0A316D8X9_9BACL|nr:isoprenyl transferase [Tumebacillus permanentifrigoris]PWK12678.1 undecaprenyl diphosphate synthase [Tumebacillus permanentifrigoris]
MLQRLKRLFTTQPQIQTDEHGIVPDAVPNHVAIIMDGNGRWARKRGMPRIAGHRAGMNKVKEISLAADDIGVKVLTLYAFSTENWKRPIEEVEFLMRLPEEWLAKELDTLIARNCRIRIIGEPEGLPGHTLRVVREAEEKTRANTGMILNIALNYGSRREILSAVRQIAEDVQAGRLTLDEIEDTTMDQHLLTAGLPDPDLLIRTSGEVRLSNFLLWQCAYTEFWFTEVFWPDFSRDYFFQAIRAFQGRGRRFGGLK